MYRVVSLFSGCGGCDQGIVGGFTFNNREYDRLPFELVYASDIDQKALNTHKLNFECPNIVCGDICEIPSDQIPDHDILIGGFNSRDPVLLVDPEKELYRRFTPREAARIQSFPDSFQFAGSETDAYRQIGNAVPPVLFWHISKKLAEILSE